MQDDGLAGVIAVEDLGVGGIVIVRLGRDAEGQKHDERENKGEDLLRVFHKLTSVFLFLIALQTV